MYQLFQKFLTTIYNS